jgi:hypothetical protein
VVFDIMDVSRIHQGSYMSIFRYLPSWKCSISYVSPERHHEVNEDAGGS